MSFQRRLTLLTSLLVYSSCANAIMVKFGTNDGPIKPPTAPPPTTEVPKPYRKPAPVWEEINDDTPDPNAQWRPTLFIPQPMHTKINYNQAENPQLTSAQKFANSYLPKHQPIPAQPIKNYFTPTQIVSQLGAQNLPGTGIRYFLPPYVQEMVRKEIEKKQEDAKLNDIESSRVVENEVPNSDLEWVREKEILRKASTNQSQKAARRTSRNSEEGTYGQRQFFYQWPVYFPRQ